MGINLQIELAYPLPHYRSAETPKLADYMDRLERSVNAASEAPEWGQMVDSLARWHGWLTYQTQIEVPFDLYEHLVAARWHLRYSVPPVYFDSPQQAREDAAYIRDTFQGTADHYRAAIESVFAVRAARKPVAA